MRRHSLLGLFALCAARGAAQTPVMGLSVGGGSATDLRGIRSSALVVAPSLRLFPAPNLTLAAAGRGIRFAGEGWSVGGATSVTTRIPVGPHLALSVGGSGDAVYASYHATYLQAEATSAAEFRLGPATIWGGVRGAVARSEVDQILAPPAGLPGQAASSITRRSMIGPSFGAALWVPGSVPVDGIRLTYREDHGRPDGGEVVDRAAGAVIARGPMVLSAGVGVREAPGEHRTFGGGQMAIRVMSGTALFGAAEWYPSNRLSGALGGRSFSAGVALSTGGPRRVMSLPRPAGVPTPAPGFTRLSIEAKEASVVEVAGDWNQWEPVPLQRSANGVWYGDFTIAPGAYRYAFRLDGRTWQVPRGVAAVNDGFGGKAAWLSVPETRRQSAKSATLKEVP